MKNLAIKVISSRSHAELLNKLHFQCLFNKDFGCSSRIETDTSDIAKMYAQIARESYSVLADPTRRVSKVTWVLGQGLPV